MSQLNPFMALASKLVADYDLASKLEAATTLEQAMQTIAPLVKNFLLQALSLTTEQHRQDPSYDALYAQLEKTYGKKGFFAEENRLAQAMGYSIEASGKMVRPTIVMAVGLLKKAPLASLLLAGAALECVHIYSLIHDDLPAMDDDDFRRGAPSNHKVFGDAHAILAGDALQSLAFSLLSANQELAAEQVLAQVQALALGAGHAGMCGGQSYDLISEGRQLPLAESELNLQLINLHKTCCLFACGANLGALSWPAKDPELQSRLATVLYNFGLVFQIKDDILDIEGDQAEIGKPVGSDLDRGKMTYVSTFGMEYCKNKITQDVAREQAILDQIAAAHPEGSQSLAWIKELLQFAINRKK